MSQKVKVQEKQKAQMEQEKLKVPGEPTVIESVQIWKVQEKLMVTRELAKRKVRGELMVIEMVQM